MAPNGTLPEPLRVTSAGGKLLIPVPWKRADSLHAYLRRHGIRSTLNIDPAERLTRLELWPGVDAAKAQSVLDAWSKN
jgi:hypothetical protein